VTQPAATTTVVAVAGRRIDAPDAGVTRFPLHNRDRVRQLIASVLRSQSVSAVISSGACGADLLALDVARRAGIRRRVILPFAVDRFREMSVVDRPGEWGALFDGLVADAATHGDLVILEAGDGDQAFAATNLAILAEGERLASTTGARRRALIVWDGSARGGDDLTDQFRVEAIARGWTVEEVRTIWSG
jgi:hypothetical protein